MEIAPFGIPTIKPAVGMPSDKRRTPILRKTTAVTPLLISNYENLTDL